MMANDAIVPNNMEVLIVTGEPRQDEVQRLMEAEELADLKVVLQHLLATD